MVNSLSFIAATCIAGGIAAGFLTKHNPNGLEAADPYALPTITLEEAKADPSLLTGTQTLSYYLNEDCTELAVVSQTVAAESFTITSRDPLDDDPLENLRCFVQPDFEECTEVNVLSSYMTEEGIQLFETGGNGDREYDFHMYGECFPTQVFGEGVYLRVFRGGEVVTDDELLVSSHAYYDIPDISLEEAQVDYTRLSGLSTNTMYATSDCSGPVIITHTHPGEGDQLYTRGTPDDNAMYSLFCMIDHTAEGCVKASGYSYRYITDEGIQIIVENGSRVYDPIPFNTCIPSQVFGDASFKVHAGGHPIAN